VGGVWFGQATTSGDSLAVRVDLREDPATGKIAGVIFAGDPAVGELIDLGKVTGTRSGGNADLQTSNGIALSGVFDADAYAGTITITNDGQSPVSGNLNLSRTPATRRGYIPIAPSRLLDTRDGGSPLGADETRAIQVAGLFGVPSTGIAAVVVNITATESAGTGFVTAFASDEQRPFTSNVYVERAGQTAGNLAIVPVSADGRISAYSLAGAHLVVDCFGWFATDSTLKRVSPKRAFDTRPDSAVGYSGPKPGPRSVVTAAFAGVSGIPSAGVSAVIVNITVTEANGPGFVTAWAHGSAQPGTANLNVERTGQTIGNLAIIPVSSDSSADLFTLTGAHLIVDVLGWFAIEPPSANVGAPSTSGTLVRDGSFEPSSSVPQVSSFATLDSTQTIGAWMVAEGAVDLVGAGSAVAQDGSQFVDLNGNGHDPGVLEQVVPTLPGRRYRVSFQLAGNPNGDPVVKVMEIAFGDGLHRYSFDTTGKTNDALGWTLQSFDANPDCGSSTVLSLRSLTPGDKGPNVDTIQVVDIGPSTSCRKAGYQAVGPARLLDTRPDSAVGYSGPKPAAGSIVKVQITGREGIPDGGLAAVVVNLTATETDAAGFVTAWASGGEQPGTSSLNVDSAGQTRPNHAIVPVGDDGAIQLFTLQGTHLIVDVFGYFTG
jgi:hypothetical protein